MNFTASVVPTATAITKIATTAHVCVCVCITNNLGLKIPVHTSNPCDMQQSVNECAELRQVRMLTNCRHVWRLKTVTAQINVQTQIKILGEKWLLLL